jgi:hypothetical protein
VYAAAMAQTMTVGPHVPVADLERRNRREDQ